jgi:hypothetical protein
LLVVKGDMELPPEYSYVFTIVGIVMIVIFVVFMAARMIFEKWLTIIEKIA